MYQYLSVASLQFSKVEFMYTWTGAKESVDLPHHHFPLSACLDTLAGMHITTDGFALKEMCT